MWPSTVLRDDQARLEPNVIDPDGSDARRKRLSEHNVRLIYFLFLMTKEEREREKNLQCVGREVDE